MLLAESMATAGEFPVRCRSPGREMYGRRRHRRRGAAAIDVDGGPGNDEVSVFADGVGSPAIAAAEMGATSSRRRHGEPTLDGGAGDDTLQGEGASRSSWVETAATRSTHHRTVGPIRCSSAGAESTSQPPFPFPARMSGDCPAAVGLPRQGHADAEGDQRALRTHGDGAAAAAAFMTVNRAPFLVARGATGGSGRRRDAAAPAHRSGQEVVQGLASQDRVPARPRVGRVRRSVAGPAASPSGSAGAGSAATTEARGAASPEPCSGDAALRGPARAASPTAARPRARRYGATVAQIAYAATCQLPATAPISCAST